MSVSRLNIGLYQSSNEPGIRPVSPSLGSLIATHRLSSSSLIHLNTGVVPYNGVVPVTANSRTLTTAEHSADPHYADVQRWCEIVAGRLGTWAVMRIDCRRQVEGGPFYLFDVNMKPVSVQDDPASASTC
jgi:hypothetical protein